jgi:outer membrane biogenesis lipoprotein LolB
MYPACFRRASNGVNLMATNQVFRSVLLACGALLIGACASQPASSPLLEKKFQREANNYQKFEHEGQAVYCKRGATKSMPLTDCITERGLRLQVENFQRSRNAVARGGPQYVSTVPGAVPGAHGH